MVASQQRSVARNYSNGPTELVAFAVCNLVVQTPLLLIWLWSQTLLQSAVASHLRVCEAFSPHPKGLGIFLMSTLLLSIVEFLLYCLILILGVAAFVGKISIFSVPRRLPQLATLLTALRTFVTAVATVFVLIFSRSCVKENPEFARVGLVLVLCAWFSLFVNGVCSCCISRRNRRLSEADYQQCCERILCYACWWGSERDREREKNAFKGLSMLLSELTTDLEDVVASDMFLGISLIRSLQIERRRRGVCYFIPEGVSLSNSERENDIGNNIALIDILHNQQPVLAAEHWDELRDARYFSRYFLAAYGAPLFAYTRPWAVCRLINCWQPDKHRFRGPHCCYCSIEAFKLWAGVSSQDIICASTLSQTGVAVYYVCADHTRKSMVLAIRGTLSLPDILSDLQAGTASLDDYGMPGGLTHTGFLEMALRLMTELNSSPFVQEFLESHPDYAVVVCGHSLGAAIGTLLSLLVQYSKDDGHLQSRRPLRVFSCGPPPMLSLELATCQHVKENVVTVVSRQDWVPRLSVTNLRRLKAQVVKVLADLARREGYATTRWQLLRSRADPDAVDYIREILKDRELLQKMEEDTELELSIESPALPNVSLFIPGQVFHIVEAKLRATRCCGRSPTPIVYPADCRAFNEIIVSSRMVMHHFPHNYTSILERLDIPEAGMELEANDSQRSRSALVVSNEIALNIA